METASTKKTTFADESPTGEHLLEYRGTGRATIAARCEAHDDFEWLARFAQDCLAKGQEAKSKVVLPLMDVSSRARDAVLKNLQNSTIVIVDFYDHTCGLVRAVYSAAKLPLPRGRDPLDALRSEPLLRPVAQGLLHLARKESVLRSSIPHVEALVEMGAKDAGVTLGSGDALFQRRALREMNDREFRELVARFSVTLGDALHPDVARRAMEKKWRELGIYAPGHIAVQVIEDAMKPNRVFDIGSDGVFQALESAHRRIEESLEAARNGYILDASAPGRISQEDSRRVLGLQAADIAAAIARREYERFPRDVRDGPGAVRQIFSNVLFNDTWI